MSDSSKVPTTIRIQGSAGMQFEDYNFQYPCQAGKYRAMVLKAGLHSKATPNGDSITIRVAFGVDNIRPGSGVRVEVYVPFGPSQFRNQLFTALGFLEEDATGKEMSLDEFNRCECDVVIALKPEKDQFGADVVRPRIVGMTPIVPGGRTKTRRPLPAKSGGAPAEPQAGGDFADEISFP